MKNKIKRMINKYYPDILILGGVCISSYSFLLEPILTLDLGNYLVDEKVTGIMLIAIGINILVRRYFNKREIKN